MKTIKFHPIFGAPKIIENKESSNFYGDKYLYLEIENTKMKINWEAILKRWTLNTMCVERCTFEVWD